MKQVTRTMLRLIIRNDMSLWWPSCKFLETYCYCRNYSPEWDPLLFFVFAQTSSTLS